MDGILAVNKPRGITSHDAVDIIRRRFNMKRVGHAGTLDPMATGVLVLLIGRATKLCDKFIKDDKEYMATLYLGQKTATQDSTGKIIEEKDVGEMDVDTVKKILNSFLGESEQIPPMVSAKKYNGRRLYKLAREGKSVVRKAVKINISDMELLEFKIPRLIFRVSCSKGTYIRTLCEDIGGCLGYPAHMSALVRTRSGRFLLKDAVDLDKVTEKDILDIEK